MVSKKAMELIKSFEGLRLRPYLCSAGVPTIGYGCTYYEDGTPVSLKDPPITKKRAEVLLFVLLGDFEFRVRKLVKIPLPEDAMGALISFSFNLGVGSLRASTLLRKLNSGDILGAADQFFRWNKAGGKVSAGLTRRRIASRALFLSAFSDSGGSAPSS